MICRFKTKAKVLNMALQITGYFSKNFPTYLDKNKASGENTHFNAVLRENCHCQGSCHAYSTSLPPIPLHLLMLFSPGKCRQMLPHG